MSHPIVARVQTAAGGGGNIDVAGNGRLTAIALDYAAGAAGTTTVTITNPDLPGSPTIAVPAGNTDRVIYPRVPIQLASAPVTDVTGRNEERPIVYGRVNVAVANAGGALNPAVTVRLFFD